jgi:hypothetical protein
MDATCALRNTAPLAESSRRSPALPRKSTRIVPSPSRIKLRDIFLRLTRLDDSDEGRDTRRRVPLDDLIPFWTRRHFHHPAARQTGKRAFDREDGQ